jgi:hypothetical protein
MYIYMYIFKSERITLSYDEGNRMEEVQQQHQQQQREIKKKCKKIY